MSTLFHYFFELARISILSMIYGYILWLIIAKFLKRKSFKIGFIVPLIFIGLIIWRNSYWRNNGYGDYGRVPLNSKYEVTMIDWWSAQIESSDSEAQQAGLTNGIEKLYLENGILFGRQSNKKFMVFNPQTEQLKNELSSEEFKKNKGDIGKLLNPDEFHGDYWGWRILFF